MKKHTAQEKALPRVLVLTLGGTITMTSDTGDGIRPTLDGAALIKAVPTLAQVAQVEAVTPFMLPGASLSLENLWQVARLVRDKLETGAFDGAVLVQGTDTIEDTAFVMDVLLAQEKPLVVTGAMRGPQAPGADGPANLLSAVTVAASADAMGCGVLVVINDEIHAARRVKKSHTSLTSAFESPGGGPVGAVVEGRAGFWARPIRRPVSPALQRLAGEPAWTPVAHLALGLGEDARLAGALKALGYGGAVVEGMGGGHVPALTVDPLSALAKQMPVVLATRVVGGPVLQGTYGFPGSEMDMLGRGLIPAGDLSSNKARLLLSLLLAAGAPLDQIKAAFA